MTEPAANAAPTPIPVGVCCPDCGYDLRGSTSDRCPECGYTLELLRTTESQIPWVHRSQLGWFRAYWRTAWQVTFRTKHFCAEAARPVSYAEAQRFRWTTVALAFGATSLGQFAYWLGNMDALQPLSTIEWLLAPINAAVFLTFVALTGLPSYFFHPRRAPLAVQNRALALSYYASAPLSCLSLALVPLVPACLFYCVHRFRLGMDPGGTAPLYLGTVALLVGMLLTWGNLINFARYTIRHRTTTGLVAAALPLLALVVGGLLLVGLPLLTLYVAVVLRSLQ